MSLVSLSSESSIVPNLVQNPNNFKNNFPQPLVLKPHSQVAITNLTFTSVDGEFFLIQGNDDMTSFSGNNKLLFGFDDADATAGYDVAILNTGKYTSAELATEIARAMNAANRMKYYTISCTFTAGQPNANAPVLDKFTISYNETAGLNPAVYSRGDWTPSNRVDSGNVIATDAQFSITDHAGNPKAVDGKKIAIADVPTGSSSRRRACTAFAWSKGLLLYTQQEGGGSYTFSVALSDGATDVPDSTSSAKIHTARFGLVRPTLAGGDLAGSIGNVDDDMKFRIGRADIKITTFRQGNGNRVRVTLSLPRYDGSPLFNDHRTRVVREFLTGGMGLTSRSFLQFRITPYYRTNDFIVQMFLSQDGGATFTGLANGLGGNADDGRPKIYTTTMGGFADGNNGHPTNFTSVIYTTQGVPDGAGGVIAGTQVFQHFLPACVALIPWVSLPRQREGVNQDSYTGLNLLDGTSDAPCLFQLNENGGTITATNKYTISFNNSATGNGYDGVITIAIAPTGADNAPVPTANIVGRAFKQDARDISKWALYADDNTPIGNAVAIGDMVYDLSNATGTLTLTGLTGGNWVGDRVGVNKPKPTTEPIYTEVSLVENPVDQVIYNRRAQDQIGSAFPHEKEFTAAPTARTLLGVIQPLGEIQSVFRGIVGRVTQSDVDDVGTGAHRRLEVGLAGNVQRLLGFSQSSFANAANDRDVESDSVVQFVRDTSSNIHVSIPELSNVKSVEGESSQQYKTIAVLPKNTFTTDESGVMSYLANYESYIDINNADDLHLNELSLQVRRPNGKISKYIGGTCRATLKFREDPERARERAFERLADRMALKQTQTSQVLINPNQFVGS